MRSLFGSLAALAGVLAATPAHAADDEFELWLSPTVSTGVGENMSVELETAQRFRQAPEDDTYFVRLWINRDVSDALELSAGIERRWEGGREIRFLQQAGYGAGIFTGRTRLEQRFVRDADRTGWRLRQRAGIALPLSEGERPWTLLANAEGFFTLRSTSDGGDHGLTAVRTIIGVEREFGKVGLTLGYLRQHSIDRDGPDRVGHAPLIGLDIAL